MLLIRVEFTCALFIGPIYTVRTKYSAVCCIINVIAEVARLSIFIYFFTADIGNGIMRILDHFRSRYRSETIYGIDFSFEISLQYSIKTFDITVFESTYKGVTMAK